MDLKLFTRRDKAPGLWSRTINEESREPVRIAVCGAEPGAGVSFICGMLAGALAREHRVTLTELGKPYFYTALGMEKRFASRPFAFYHSIIGNGQSLRSVYNVGESINWAVRHPRDRDPMEPSELFRCFSTIPGEMIIFDCSSLDAETAKAVLAEADRRVIVVDPMPTGLFDAFPFLEDVRLRFADAIIVVNKMNDGVHRGELTRFFGSRECVFIPLVTPELLYKAEYNSLLPWSISGIIEECGNDIKQLVEKITKKSFN
ncbi:MAG: hypothetical protein MJ194_03405 [Clostridia bacterium]|nr:hypothetical protein [Clostridia bacterium]